ncbi:polysaccharide deacetylase family protein [Paenibacillus sp. P26]|nr:polysaccharide deacetylase family protein [Paenibacillus sp. P26]UUZ94682.1 polysaccharide deacetylase family protein [Paenibacillus sp. P25]
MRTFLPKVMLLLLIGLGTLPFIGSGTPNYIYKDQVAVLMYHHLSDTAKSNVTITPKLFRDQLTYLQQQNYHFISLRQFEHYMAGGAVPDNAVLVTFDDGYKSFHDIGYPILKDLGIPAVNFIITNYAEHPDSGNIPYASMDELKEMTRVRSEGIDFQCHSDQLHGEADGKPLLTTLLTRDGHTETAAEHDERILSDTRACISKLRTIYQTRADAYAYPFGTYDAEASSLLSRSGIRYAFTVVSEMATRDDDPLQIPRITAGNPSISPEELNRSILRKAVDLKQTFDYVPFRDTVGQVGGTMIQDKDETINFYYHNHHWKTRVDSSTVTLGDQMLTLSQPVIKKGRKAQIQLDDLQKVMGIRIVYNPVLHTFSERLTPSRDAVRR